MDDVSRVRILILDDEAKHCEEIKALLSQITPQQWRDAGGPKGFSLNANDIETSQTCISYIDNWRQKRVAHHDLIFADVNMGENQTNEGALAVYEALAQLPEPPALIVITQFPDARDAAREEISRRARGPDNRVPTLPPSLITAKFTALSGVAEPDRQLSTIDWRRLVTRAIAHRRNFESIQRLDHMAQFWWDAKDLVAFETPLARFRERLGYPVVVLVSEPGSFEEFMVRGHYEDLPDPFSLLGYEAESVLENLFGAEAEISLRRVGQGAILLLNTDNFLKEVSERISNDSGTQLSQFQDLRQNRKLASGEEFNGQLFLSVSIETHTRLNAVPGFYRTLPKVELPRMENMRDSGDMKSLLHFLLRRFDLRLEPLDIAVLHATDWRLGFQDQDTGFTALHNCLKWALEHGSRPPRGIVTRALTEKEEAREEIYRHLEPAGLLLYILDRMRQITNSTNAQLAAFFYYKYAFRSKVIDTVRVRERFWREKGIFDALANDNSFNLRDHIEAARQTKDWPKVSDRDLYYRKAGNSGKNTGAKIKEFFEHEIDSGAFNIINSNSELTKSLWEQIQLLLADSTSGRTPDEDMRRLWKVMESPYEADPA